jgi:hypothetical protein
LAWLPLTRTGKKLGTATLRFALGRLRRQLIIVRLRSQSAGPLAVRLPQHPDCQRASKPFAAHPCKRPVAAKHILLCLPDFAIETTLSYLDKSCPFNGTFPSVQHYRNMTIPAHLPRLCIQDNFIITALSLKEIIYFYKISNKLNPDRMSRLHLRHLKIDMKKPIPI